MLKPYTEKGFAKRVKVGVVGLCLLFTFMWAFALAQWWPLRAHPVVGRLAFFFGLLLFLDAAFLAGLIKANGGLRAFWRNLARPFDEFTRLSYLCYFAILLLSIVMLAQLVIQIGWHTPI